MEDYEIFRKIGEGTYANVYIARCHDDNEVYAIKSINKEIVTKNCENFDALVNEIDVMRFMDHPSILKLYRVYED